MIAFKTAMYVALVGFLALVVAVAVAVASLPGYDELARRTDLGQMIRVRANNGTVLVSLGPSFGQWLRYDQIPPQMRAAMISVEDNRFRNHFGVDPVASPDRARCAMTAGAEPGRSTITSTGANIFLTNSRTFARKVKEGVLARRSSASSARTRSRAVSQPVYSAAAPMASTPPRSASSAHRRHAVPGVRRRSSPAWSRRRPTIAHPMPRPLARARAWCSSRWSTNGFVRATAARSVNPAQIALQPTSKQNSVRYFTDWPAPARHFDR